jgi:molybdopterin synthase catalytic subunit
MSIRVQIIDGPLPASAAPPTGYEGAGALLLFEGIVRPTEGDRSIRALLYRAYQPMADFMLEELAEDLLAKHDLIAIEVEHSQGEVKVGQCSFRLRIASRHRGEGLDAMEEFVNRLKRDVPIWKTPMYEPAVAEGKP